MPEPGDSHEYEEYYEMLDMQYEYDVTIAWKICNAASPHFIAQSPVKNWSARDSCHIIEFYDSNIIHCDYDQAIWMSDANYTFEKMARHPHMGWPGALKAIEARNRRIEALEKEVKRLKGE